MKFITQDLPKKLILGAPVTALVLTTGGGTMATAAGTVTAAVVEA